MMRAELDGIVCNGARRGKQFTYALLDERVPDAKPMARDEALVELATRYFTTRGPATAHDFAWWSGLTVTDAKRALADIGDGLQHETIDGTTYWFAGALPSKPPRSTAWLLPNFDEYFIAFADRGAMLERVARCAARRRECLHLRQHHRRRRAGGRRVEAHGHPRKG